MEDAALQKRRRQLMAMAAELRGQLADSETESSQELSSYDNHPADLGTDTFRREFSLGLAADLSRRLNQVERAQEKMREGSYGRCDHCGQSIDADRLRVLPEAIYCARCQEAVAAATGPAVRTSAYQNVMGADKAGAWREVSQYGTSDTPQDIRDGLDYESLTPSEDELGVAANIESLVDEAGSPLLDAWREQSKRHQNNSASSSDGENDSLEFPS